MEVFRLKELCILLPLYFSLAFAGKALPEGRIRFQAGPDNTLEVSTPPPATTVGPIETRMDSTSNMDSVGDNEMKNPKDNAHILHSEIFSFDMLYAISNALQEYDANIVLSPFSIWSLMILIAEGAKDDSFKQLSDVLHLPNDLRSFRTAYLTAQELLTVNRSAIEVAVNQILVADRNRPLEERYLHILLDEYKVDPLLVHFDVPEQAANTINKHIEIKTHGKIPNIVSPEELAQVHLLLASTVFFRAEWKFKFNKDQTKKLPFYDENEAYLADVPMMTQQNHFRSVILDGLHATVVELPYGNDDRFSMLLLQPLSTLNTVFEHLKHFSIANIYRALASNTPEDDEEDDGILVTLPKFKIESDLDLRTVFEHLGAVNIFYQSKADLTRMTSEELHVSNVFHKATVEVDEFGTIAAAVSIAEKTSECAHNRSFSIIHLVS